ncbi:MAG: hypothetical protein IJ689_06250 [Alphaproteobacteria bacterium]|nr:hypothetical protein [Alphaproteobacteria bacterium]
MKNYILMLGVAGVALGSYAAMASNSATMTVTATIAHDVSLTVTRDITISAVVNPAVTSVSESWCISGDDNPENEVGYCISNWGLFTATVPDDYYAITNNKFTISPSELTHDTLKIQYFAVGDTSTKNQFQVGGNLTYSGGAPSAGTHNFGNITITYHP